MPTPADRAAELRKIIDRHNHLYYVEAAPEMSVSFSMIEALIRYIIR